MSLANRSFDSDGNCVALHSKHVNLQSPCLLEPCCEPTSYKCVHRAEVPRVDCGAKVAAQIGRGTTADVEVYCWLGSHT